MSDWKQKGAECGQQAAQAAQPKPEQEGAFRAFCSSFDAQFPVCQHNDFDARLEEDRESR